jgi:hypothetical protein
MHGKKARIKSSFVMESNTLAPPLVSILYVFEEVYNMVGFAKVVLDVVVLGGDSEFDKLVLERSALLKETMYLTIDFHMFIFLSFKISRRGMSFVVTAYSVG